MRRERRVHQRYATGSSAWELEGKLLRPVARPGAHKSGKRASIRGRVADIGGGGLCLVSSDKADPDAAVRGEICDPRTPVRIPTLLQVRWVHPNPDGHTYRLGLQFLL
jgi:hypothetical protein